MTESDIYIIGKADNHSGLLEKSHALGYKFGILYDSNLEVPLNDAYDQVIAVNYGDIDNEIVRLKTLDLRLAGVVCTYENYIVAKAKIGDSFMVPTISVESAQLATDKSKMRDAFLNYDQTISPMYRTIDVLEEAVEFANTYGYPIIIKPTNLVKSLLVLRCNDEEDLRSKLTYAFQEIDNLYKKYRIYDKKPQLIIEEFIHGKQCSIAAFVDSEGKPHFCEGIVSLETAQDIQIDDNYLFKRNMPAEINQSLSNTLFTVAESGIRALKMHSVPAHVELIYDGDSAKIVEIGARIGGYRPRMYDMSYGLDLNTEELKLAVGQTPYLAGTFTSYTAVYELFPDKIGTFTGLPTDIQTNEYTYFRITAAAGDEIGPAKNGFKATVIVIVNEADKEIFDKKCHQITKIKIEVN